MKSEETQGVGGIYLISWSNTFNNKNSRAIFFVFYFEYPIGSIYKVRYKQYHHCKLSILLEKEINRRRLQL